MSDLFDISILTDYQDYYLKGFLNTIESSLLALIGSFVIGVLIAIFRISPWKPLNWLGTIYVEFIRNVPLLIHAFVFYHGLPSIGINLSGFQAGTIGLAVYTAAYIAEAIRAGINSVPKGLVEAGRSSGLTYLQTMRFIVLPQAIKIVLPPLGNQFINLIKNSSILGVFAGMDLMYQGDLVNADTFNPFPTYIFVAMFYLVLTIPMSLFVNYLERRLARSN
jgi:aspartate/glutamate/glutamine transport system permease protein